MEMLRSWWIWKCYLIVLMLLRGGTGVESFVGVNWGRHSTHTLVASSVVDLLLQNGISDVRMFAPRPNALVALEHSSIGVTVTLSRDFLLRDKFISNLQNVSEWVSNLIVPPIQRNVNITTVIVMHQPFLSATTKAPIVWNLTEVFKETRWALDSHNLTHVRTTTSHYTDAIKVAKTPSEAEFRDDIKDMMAKHLEVIAKTNSFFTLDILPITAIETYKWPVEFGFMDNKSNFTVVDGKYRYTNAFEFLYDSAVVALAKAGYPDMEVVLGQIGWPTDGTKDATPENAARFYRGFIPHMVNKKGTPRRRNKNIDAYLYTISDENKMSFPAYGPYIRHYGIYEYDGTPKFEIDFSGKGRKVLPPAAKGTVKLPLRWCVFNGNVTNEKHVELHMQAACNFSDCTSLQPGGSCSNLNFTSRVSYAFNAFYQLGTQDALPCGGYSGLGVITMADPSEGDCKFPVEILTAETVDDGRQVFYTVTYDSSSAAPFNLSLSLSVALLLFVIVLLAFNR
ncbi:PREDICTED: glucan endo-1,3-beta-glucosidase 8-like [Ipomoea nil]|uniref:glucan endo-1,3-beta-glucosidase 8-like n=1 Tax=Ipomoea nil TaxID=35883 RepID=UPI0009008B37|nr:PREDICTED: glucan endo-1,3-beta-glucosidase 8-like [Ipomoea nil]